ncbi:ROK family transcriptional regulator [Mucilaginibacter myungsuensis]|uniref:ROK family transcriptional regulator n=1 Tax=Mucilaginibacter myungsuensis TaxID=649104 RepID=A0A929L1E8_9SPHI|nr:ROK family transcriptional regulator [Mucilaginibacter myungsuensis]MBE9664495.1 ROK family transcriptional regulator [Mucilaginibacter myungsuensis]MDN3601360.1 ROK family transcriptional regulator [Mucilaginibacter myungsuensis]
MDDIQPSAAVILDKGKLTKDELNTLGLIFELGQATNAQICDRLNLSLPSVNKILKQLQTAKLIQPGEQQGSSGGRRPSTVKLCPGLFYIVAVDIEVFGTRVAVYDNNLMLQCQAEIPFTLTKSRDGLPRLADQINAFISINNYQRRQLIGISFSIVGLIDEKNGESCFYLRDEADGVPIRDYLQDLFSLPVTIHNDVNAAAQAELMFGEAKGKTDALVLSMDIGVGLGIILDGAVRKGAKGFSGEIGHIPMAQEGELCYCGKQGCLETVASGSSLIKNAKQAIAAGQNTMLSQLCGHNPDHLQIAMVIEAANKGDLFAIELLSQVGSTMGRAISTMIQIFNPEIVILGGKIANAGQYMTLPMLQALNTYCMIQIREQTQITVSKLGDNAKLLGVAYWGVKNFLR